MLAYGFRSPHQHTHTKLLLSVRRWFFSIGMFRTLIFVRSFTQLVILAHLTNVCLHYIFKHNVLLFISLLRSRHTNSEQQNQPAIEWASVKRPLQMSFYSLFFKIECEKPNEWERTNKTEKNRIETCIRKVMLMFVFKNRSSSSSSPRDEWIYRLRMFQLKIC